MIGRTRNCLREDAPWAPSVAIEKVTQLILKGMPSPPRTSNPKNTRASLIHMFPSMKTSPRSPVIPPAIRHVFRLSIPENRDVELGSIVLVVVIVLMLGMFGLVIVGVLRSLVLLRQNVTVG